MPIHEKSLIRPENLVTHEHLTIDGVDVSGHWSTFINSRVVTDYNEDMQEEIAALPGGEFIHRCWQCGSCTNACTVNALNPDFNPRYWIYLIRMGFEDELAARQGPDLAVRLLQQMHLCLPARREPRRGDEGDRALAGAEGPRRAEAGDGLRRRLLRRRSSRPARSRTAACCSSSSAAPVSRSSRTGWWRWCAASPSACRSAC